MQAGEKRDYFSWLVADDIFSDDEMKGRNCKGICDKTDKTKIKLPLDKTKLDLVHNIAFIYYPIQSHESMKLAWAKCIQNIDGRLRKKFPDGNYMECTET